MSTLAGVTHRIGELVEVLQGISNSHDSLSQNSRDQDETTKKLGEDVDGEVI